MHGEQQSNFWFVVSNVALRPDILIRAVASFLAPPEIMPKNATTKQRDRLRRRVGHVDGQRRPRTAQEMEAARKAAEKCAMIAAMQANTNAAHSAALSAAKAASQSALDVQEPKVNAL